MSAFLGKEEFQADLDRLFPNREYQTYVLNLMGKILNNDLKNKIVYFHGPGNNGKTAFINLIRETFGIATFTRKVNCLDNDVIRRLEEVRFAFVSESHQLSAGDLKTLCGGDSFFIRTPSGAGSEITLKTTPIVCINSLDEIGNYPGIKARAEVVYFPTKFEKSTHIPYEGPFACCHFFSMVVDEYENSSQTQET